MRIIELSECDSTNEYLKRLDGEEDTVVTALRQTAGKGTKGRSFSSADGGLYLSVMRFYENFPAANAFEIMINSCVAVCKTVEGFGIKPVIRWANDVLVNGRKICGTLIENTFAGANIRRSIVGMGINVNNELPSELRQIAVSMCEILGKMISLQTVKQALIANLQKSFTINDYKKYIDWFGKEVVLRTDKESYTATALDVTADGRLVVSRDGKIIEISSAEVSLRL
ncbi:MAG: biotin--[acetyl-CoA-carboxylase] ligase [Clostridia bacterium]|nr:biotin--[acetyl-CoA-carboxylase] ligase [Clostridia bacterium]